MGVARPRTPAVHRGAAILDAIATGAADTPAALSECLGLAKSSLTDLLGAMEIEHLTSRSPDGHLHIGGRWAALSDPDAAVDRLFRACARTPELDGHTTSVGQLLGNLVVCVDVHPGRHPLPLTPRAGQRMRAADTAGAIAILSSVPVTAATEMIRVWADHLGLTEEQVARTLALRLTRRRSVYASHSTQAGRQIACAVAGTRLALTLHLPNSWSDPALVRRAGRALNAAANDS
ncbi:helix-turn-helix domain-containing protein [Mycobacterium sp. 21AC1]|uniref:helix-turn-helix domain-containing protein n=1 Tax=[Mycobacterium] appelbergii TaxID=2939269 RepID=UPI0029394E96|nr:helix-turn-helix domain-containing protein [Mycobacterium sp. 21AC1]MDV3128001.1 helix-turn-helix domain-containing protein [Mycobacterium sp. 21AC1]